MLTLPLMMRAPQSRWSPQDRAIAAMVTRPPDRRCVYVGNRVSVPWVLTDTPPSCTVHVVLVIVVVAMLSATGSLRGLLPNKMVQVAMLVSLLSSTMGASPVQSVELFAGCQSVSNGIREHGYASVALDFSTCRWGICLLTLFARRLQSSYQ